MQISNWIIFGTVETFAVLLVVCILLLLHTRKLKGLVNHLHDRIQGLVRDLKQAKADIKRAQTPLDPRTAHIQQLDRLIEQTRQHHASHDPDRDIVLDLSNDTPLARQIAAVRFATLISEKEAILSSNNEMPNWMTLEDKFARLLHFFQQQTIPQDGDSSATADLRKELDASLQRVENLEKFKQLFFTMENQWQDAKQQADDYYQQLSQMTVSEKHQASFDELLANYNNVYNQLGDSIESAASRPAQQKPHTITNTIEVVKVDKRAEYELRQLRTVATDQHRLISELQDRLRKASTDAEKVEVIRDLQKQLDRQVRFVTESETCIQLLETELNEANQNVLTLENTITHLKQQAQQLPSMQTAITEYAAESKSMLQTIERLEQENKQLAGQAEMSTSAATGTATEKEELARLKQQYAELESRYLELRMRK